MDHSLATTIQIPTQHPELASTSLAIKSGTFDPLLMVDLTPSSQQLTSEQVARLILRELGMNYESGLSVEQGIKEVFYSPKVREVLEQNPLTLLKIAVGVWNVPTQYGDWLSKEQVRTVIKEDLPLIIPALRENISVEHLEVLAEIAGTVPFDTRHTLFRWNLRCVLAMHTKDNDLSAEQLRSYSDVLLSDYPRFHNSADPLASNLISSMMAALGTNPSPESLKDLLTETQYVETELAMRSCKAHHMDYSMMPWLKRSIEVSEDPTEIRKYSDRIIKFADDVGTTHADHAVNIPLKYIPGSWNGDFSFELFDAYVTSMSDAIESLAPYQKQAITTILDTLIDYGVEPKQFKNYFDVLSKLKVLNSEEIFSLIPALFKPRESESMTPGRLDEYVSVIVEVGCIDSFEFGQILQMTGDGLSPENYRLLAESFLRMQKIADKYNAPYVTQVLYSDAVSHRECRNWDDMEPWNVVYERMQSFERFVNELPDGAMKPQTDKFSFVERNHFANKARHLWEEASDDDTDS